MAITQGIVTSFKVQMMRALHDFTSGASHTFKMALYTSSAVLDATTTAYTATGEISATGYTAGGMALTIPTSPVYPVSSGNTAFVDFNDAVWATGAITGARGARSITRRLRRADQSGGGGAGLRHRQGFGVGAFTVVFATPDSLNAVVRIA
jgi:hypothetical protein